MNGVSIAPLQVTTTGIPRVNLESLAHIMTMTIGLARGVNLENLGQEEVHGVSLESRAEVEDHGVRVASLELVLAHGPQERSHHHHGRQSLVLTSGLLLLPFVIHQHRPSSLPSLAQPPRLVNSVMTTMYGIGTHLAIHATMVPTKVAQLQEYLHLQVVKLVVDVLQRVLPTWTVIECLGAEEEFGAELEVGDSAGVWMVLALVLALVL